MNYIAIMGRITKDPELKTTNSGTDVCNFTVAVDRFAKKGEEKQTDFIDVTAWGKSGVFVNQYFSKGAGIIVEGRMESRKWVDKDGNNRVSWGVTAEDIHFPVGGGKKNDGAADAPTFTEMPTDDGGELPF